MDAETSLNTTLFASGAGGLSHEELCSLSVRQRIQYVNALYVLYPRAERILRHLEHCYFRTESGVREPPCALVTGRLGAGKTILSELLLDKHPATMPLTPPSPRHPSITKLQPIVRFALPELPREKALPQYALAAMGDPLASKGSKTELTRRLFSYLQERGTFMVIVDELQHLIESQTLNILLDASDWLKNLAKEAHVSLVLVGIQGPSEIILEANEQLSSLFSDPLVLEPFSWSLPSETKAAKASDTNDVGSTRDEFLTLLSRIESLLPLREPSNLADLDIAQRLYVASGGLMRYLMRLLSAATVLALQHGRERLTRQMLFAAFRDNVGGYYRGVVNPFSAGSNPPEPKPLPPVRTYRIDRSYRGGPLRVLPFEDRSRSAGDADEAKLRAHLLGR